MGSSRRSRSGFSRSKRARGHAAALTAGEVVDEGVRGREAQGIHGALDDAIDLPAAAGVDLVLELGVLLEQLVHVRRVLAELHADLLEARDEGARLGHGEVDLGLHGVARGELRLLLEEADARAVRRLSLARVLVVDAGHDPQQRALAAAVVAEDADLGAGIEREPQALQHLLVRRVDLADVLHRENELMSHGSLPLRRRSAEIARLTYGERAAAVMRLNGATVKPRRSRLGERRPGCGYAEAPDALRRTTVSTRARSAFPSSRVTTRMTT